ncbi:MAG: CPXCG motif-containing cysteine-rich protein [Candidatus Rariloculaceae bacterium]
MLSEKNIDCPCCGEQIAIVLDLSVAEQRYVEDCSVCCRPIVLQYSSTDSELTELTVHPEGGE